MCQAGSGSRRLAQAGSAEQHVFPPAVIHTGALQIAQSGSRWGRWVGRRTVEEWTSLLYGLSGDACRLPVTLPGCSVGRSLCRTDICTGRESLGRTKGDTGNLEMVSVRARCGDTTRCGRTGCGGTVCPRPQLWNLRTSVPSRMNLIRVGPAAGIRGVVSHYCRRLLLPQIV